MPLWTWMRPLVASCFSFSNSFCAAVVWWAISSSRLALRRAAWSWWYSHHAALFCSCIRWLWALTLAFQISSCSSGSGLSSCDARLEISRSNSASTVSTRLPSLDEEQTFAVAGKKERTSRGGLSFPNLIGPGETEDILPLSEPRCTDYLSPALQGGER